MVRTVLSSLLCSSSSCVGSRDWRDMYHIINCFNVWWFFSDELEEPPIPLSKFEAHVIANHADSDGGFATEYEVNELAPISRLCLPPNYALTITSPRILAAATFCVECLVTWSTLAQKPKLAANPWNTLAVSTELPASISADSVLTVSRAMKLGPGAIMGQIKKSCLTANLCLLCHFHSLCCLP